MLQVLLPPGLFRLALFRGTDYLDIFLLAVLGLQNGLLIPAGFLCIRHNNNQKTLEQMLQSISSFKREDTGELNYLAEISRCEMV